MPRIEMTDEEINARIDSELQMERETSGIIWRGRPRRIPRVGDGPNWTVDHSGGGANAGGLDAALGRVIAKLQSEIDLRTLD